MSKEIDIAALRKAAQGWVLVPEEPTDHMCQIGRRNMPREWARKEYGAVTDKDAADVYQAMLAAAPYPPGGLAALLDRLEQAERDATNQRGRNHALQMAVVATQGDAARMREKLEQAEMDAAMYRWLRSNASLYGEFAGDYQSGWVVMRRDHMLRRVYSHTGPELDAAISAAMQGEGA